ncbi:MAG: methyl-accepting chemotaxis protein [Spirochaetes bacterium]|nr:methyl-accepting chemotaxis protein [Spirochaetota bacterium]
MNLNKNYGFKIFLFTFLSIFIALILYSLLVPRILFYNPNETIHFIKKMFTNGLIIGILASLIVYLYYKPTEKFMKLFLKNNDKNQFFKILSITNGITVFIFYVGVIFYPIGTFVNTLHLLINLDKSNIIEILSRYILAINWGLINGLITARLLEIILHQIRNDLGIYKLDDNIFKKYYFSLTKRLFTPLLFLFFMIINSSIFFIYFNSVKFISFKDTIIKALWIYLLLFFIFCVIIFIIILEYQTSLKKLLSQVYNLAKGKFDFNKRILINSFDDVGYLTSLMNIIIDNMEKIFNEIKQDTKFVSDSISNMDNMLQESKNIFNSLHESSKILEENYNTQDKIIRDVTTGLNETIKIIETTIDNIEVQNEKINQIDKKINDFLEEIKNTNSKTLQTKEEFENLFALFNKCFEQVEISSKIVKDLGDFSKKINKTISIINSIAEKTNLLSMNASIEAAHAGKFGEGFAVVANEIRNLSENTTTSSVEIVSIIKNMDEKIILINENFNNLNNIFNKILDSVKNSKEIIEELFINSKNQLDNSKITNDNLKNLINLTEKIREGTLNFGSLSEDIVNNIKKLNEISTKSNKDTTTILNNINMINDFIITVNQNFTEINKRMDELKENI